jgi:hypothetical protein
MGYVIITLDDSYLAHRTLAAPYARSKGITLGFAMIPGLHTGNIGRMNVQQARECQDVYGHECYTHACTSTDHDNTSLFTSADSYVAAENSIIKAKQAMAAQGLCANNTHEVFVAPPASPVYGDSTIGAPSNSVMARHFICRRTFQSNFPDTTTGGSETVPPMNLFHIRTAGWNGNTVANARTLISRTRENPYAVAVLVFHDLVTSGAAGVFILQSDWQSVIDEVAFQRDNNYQSNLSSGTAAGKLRVATLSQLVRGQLTPTL